MKLPDVPVGRKEDDWIDGAVCVEEESEPKLGGHVETRRTEDVHVDMVNSKREPTDDETRYQPGQSDRGADVATVLGMLEPSGHEAAIDVHGSGIGDDSVGR